MSRLLIRMPAAAPIIAAIGGVIAPAAVYLAINPGPTAAGWAAPTDTGIAFTLAILAIFGARASSGLKAFIAAYAVVDDILSVLANDDTPDEPCVSEDVPLPAA